MPLVALIGSITGSTIRPGSETGQVNLEAADENAPMKWADYIYYCIYRFVLKTPARSYADAWPIAFLALTLWTHVLTVYFLITLAVGKAMDASLLTNKFCISVIVGLIVLFFWHYVLRGNAARVISSFEKRGDERKYARVGAIMFVETVLLPLTLVCLLILGTKLKG